MANTPFGYQRTQAITQPQAQKLTVQANQSAAEAFKGLSSIVEGYQKIETAKIQAEAQSTSAQMQHMRMVNADIEKMIKLKEDEIHTAYVDEINEDYRIYTEKKNEAGLDIKKQTELFQAFSDKLSGSYDSLPDSVKRVTQDKTNSYLTTTHGDFLNIQNAIRKQEYEASVSTHMSTALATGDIPTVLNTIKQLQASGKNVNMTPDQVLESVTDYMNVYTDATMDAKALANGDTSGIEFRQNLLDSIYALDKKSTGKKYTLAMQARTNQMIDQAVSYHTGLKDEAIANGSYGQFTESSDALERLGIMDTRERVQEELKFSRINAKTPTELIKAEAQAGFARNGNFVNISAQPVAAQAEYTKLTRDHVRTQLLDLSKADPVNLRRNATQNPTQYGQEFDAIVSDLTKEIRSAFNIEDPAERAAAIQGSVQHLVMLETQSYNTLSDESRLAITQARMIADGRIDINNRDARLTANASDLTLKPTDSKYVEELQLTLNAKDFAEARREYSVMRHWGVSEDDALKQVQDDYAIQETKSPLYGDVSYTPKLLREAAKLGLDGKQLGYIPDVLTDVTLGIVNNEAKLYRLEDITQGDNLTLRFEENSLVVASEAGTELIALNPANADKLKQEVLDRYRNDNEEAMIEHKAATGNAADIAVIPKLAQTTENTQLAFVDPEKATIIDGVDMDSQAIKVTKYVEMFVPQLLSNLRTSLESRDYNVSSNARAFFDERMNAVLAEAVNKQVGLTPKQQKHLMKVAEGMRDNIYKDVIGDNPIYAIPSAVSNRTWLKSGQTVDPNAMTDAQKRREHPIYDIADNPPAQ